MTDKLTDELMAKFNEMSKDDLCREIIALSKQNMKFNNQAQVYFDTLANTIAERKRLFPECKSGAEDG